MTTTTTTTATTTGRAAGTAPASTVRARRSGVGHAVLTIAGRAIRAVPRDAEVIIPPIVIALFFFLVNVATLSNLTRSNIAGFDYEAFQKMVEHQFNLLFDQVAKQWPIESVRLVHRIGLVKVNEPSLWVEVIAPHRGEAFAACQWLIDEMKRVVPIWKRPQFS